MLPYTITHRFTTANANDVAALAFPNQFFLSRVSCIGAIGSTYDLTFYSRDVSPAAITVVSITDNGEGKCRIRAAAPLARLGDKITVAGNGVTAYNTTHVVTRAQSDYVDTDRTYTDTGLGGTSTLTLSTAEAELYQIADKFAAGTGGVVRAFFPGGLVAANHDPSPRGGQPQLIYAQMSVADTYVLVLTGYKEGA